jgi:hypothetical protein
MPITEVNSPINRSKGWGCEGVKHAAIYGDRRNDAARPTSRPAPGEVTDGTLTIKPRVIEANELQHPTRAPRRPFLSLIVEGTLRRDDPWVGPHATSRPQPCTGVCVGAFS